MSTNEDTTDLDAFLVSVESKLRGPFSSLDFTKAVTTTALRQSSPREYLERIQEVLPRLDKVVQVRVLVGLLGLDPSHEIDDVVYNILTSAEKEHEEWVRAVAGLVRGIMFEDGDGSRDSCRGEDAQQLLEKTCQDVIERVSDHEGKGGIDLDPLFIPYYYSLLNPDNLQSVAPRAMENPHFLVNNDAEILNYDEHNEKQKIQDGDEAAKIARRQQVATNGTEQTSIAKQDLPTMPGVRALSNLKSKPVAASGSTSLFMPKKGPHVPGGRMGMQVNTKRNGSLHTRKAGAAQALLTKSRRPGGAAPSLASASASATVNRSMKYGTNRSKMKMLDVSEVQGLTKEHQERETIDNRSIRKRKLMEAAAASGLVKKTKPNAVEVPAKPAAIASPPITSKPTPALEATAAAALRAYQMQNNPAPITVQAVADPESSANDASNSNWEQLLERSNKLEAGDRERIRQFFVDRFNPTPDIPVCRIKLHEERTTEQDSGVQVKETLYLELDYNTFGFKKLKKTKKK